MLKPALAPSCLCSALLLSSLTPLGCGDRRGESGEDSPALDGGDSSPAGDDSADAATGGADSQVDGGWEADEGAAEDSGDEAIESDHDSGEEGDIPRFDLGSIPEVPPPQEGCAKVDFLFVIDNSGSMGDEQQNLKSSFPGFMAAIETTLELSDFHVMVVDTDAGSSGGSSSCQNGVCTCSPDPSCCTSVCERPGNRSCNGKNCDDLDLLDCDIVLGAGKIENDERNQACNFAGPGRFITNRDPDLTAAFTCAASVGIRGDITERPMAATIASLTAPLVDRDGCNEGFLRDDALLVVTVITDEAEDPAEGQSPGDPMSWFTDVVATKAGIEESIVVLGLIGDRDLADPVCQLPNDQGSGGEPSPRLRAFVESFTHGLTASVCEPDYGPFFEAAVSVIDNACQDFDPPNR